MQTQPQALVPVTLLQSATLGRQSLASGVSLHVHPDLAQQWVDAGIATASLAQPLAEPGAVPEKPTPAAPRKKA